MSQLMSFAKTPAGQVLIIGAVAGLAVYVARKAAIGAAKAVNPVSDENVIYQGANAVGSSLTGDEDFVLGYWIYDQLHGGD